MKKTIKLTVFLTDLTKFSELNEVFELFFVALLLFFLVYIESYSSQPLVNYLPFLGMFVVIATRLFTNLGSLTSNVIAIKIHMPSINLIYELLSKTNEKQLDGTKNFDKLKSDIKISADRRYKEIIQSGSATTYEDVLLEVSKRDKTDTKRIYSPLKKADDSIEIDVSNKSVDQIFNDLVLIIDNKIKQTD